MVTDEDKLALKNAAQIPHMPTDLTYEARRAVSGEGQGRMADDWQDKPHRVVYDLCRRIEELEAALAPVQAEGTYQQRVAAAHGPLFDGDPTDVAERRDRNFEEAIETAQAFHMTEDDAIALVRYTFNRPVGDPTKELGSQILTAFSLAVEAGIDAMAAAEADLAKLCTPETIARIRAKRATRHGRGPLPGLSPATSKGEAE